MDALNKTAMTDKNLQYYYKEDPNITIGVLGFVDDTLGVSQCSSAAIQKNAVLNFFSDSQRPR